MQPVDVWPYRPPDGKWSPSPVDTKNPTGVAVALPTPEGMF